MGTQRRLDEEDDTLAELPELDGDDDERGALDDEQDRDAESEDGAELDVGEGGASDLDDATGEGDPLDELTEGDEKEGSWLLDAGPSDLPDIDVLPEIPDDPRGAGSLLLDNDEQGVGDDDFDLGGDETGSVGVDAGEEGPTDADEELRDEDLPALDADDDGEVDESTLYELAVGDEDNGLPWPEEPWTTAMSPLDVGHVVAVACAPRGLVARHVSGQVVQIDLDGEVRDLATHDALRRALAGDPRLDPADKDEAEDTFGVRRQGGEITAVAEIDADTWIAAVYDPSDARSVLVRAVRAPSAATPQERRRVVVCEIVGRVADLAWDAARGLVWAGGDFGVVPLHPRVSSAGDA
jgi:hypothetical protein